MFDFVMLHRTSERSQAQLRAENALTEAFKRANPCVGVVRGRIEELEQNLLPGVHRRQFEHDLLRGAGKELLDKFRAPYSSSALVVNCFARFKNSESHLRLGEYGDFRCMSFEREFATGLPGTPPHLDVVLVGHEQTLAIESKCTEQLGVKTPSFKASYDRLLKSSRQSKPWLDEMVAIRHGRHQYRYLDAAQLIKHALGLANSCQNGNVMLLYLYWEPKNAGGIQELKDHGQELRSFSEHVAGGFPIFRAVSYRQLWAQWATMKQPVWLGEHVSRLRERYDVEI